jgi:hypothetical protein
LTGAVNILNPTSLFVLKLSSTAIGVKNRIIEGCKCQVLLLKAVSKNIFFCVALTAGELVVGHILVFSIGVICKWNAMGKLCECNVNGKFSKNKILYDMLFTSEFCLCFFFGASFVRDSDVLLSLF